MNVERRLYAQLIIGQGVATEMRTVAARRLSLGTDATSDVVDGTNGRDTLGDPASFHLFVSRPGRNAFARCSTSIPVLGYSPTTIFRVHPCG